MHLLHNGRRKDTPAPYRMSQIWEALKYKNGVGKMLPTAGEKMLICLLIEDEPVIAWLPVSTSFHSGYTGSGYGDRVTSSGRDEDGNTWAEFERGPIIASHIYHDTKRPIEIVMSLSDFNEKYQITKDKNGVWSITER